MNTSYVLSRAACFLVLLALTRAGVAEDEGSALVTTVDSSAEPTFSLTGYYPGVNLAGAEFGKGTRLGRDFTYPKTEEFAYFQSKGMRVIRMPFRWARVQPQLRGEFDTANIAEIDRCIQQANDVGLVVLLDVHDYGARSVNGKSFRVGVDPELTVDDFCDLWIRLAKRYQDRPLVWFGLMNEPHKISAEVNAQNMQAAINAIRATGAKNFVTVPGCSWTGAHSWVSSGNAAAYESFKDPADNFAFEVHQYLDKDSSGTKPEAVAGAGSKRLLAFTAWAKKNHFKGFLGEFGWDQNPENIVAQQEGEALLACMDQNKDVWVGYSYWAAGPWWPKTYMFSLEPEGLKEGAPIDKPQMAIIAKYLR